MHLRESVRARPACEPRCARPGHAVPTVPSSCSAKGALGALRRGPLPATGTVGALRRGPKPAGSFSGRASRTVRTVYTCIPSRPCHTSRRTLGVQGSLGAPHRGPLPATCTVGALRRRLLPSDMNCRLWMCTAICVCLMAHTAGGCQSSSFTADHCELQLGTTLCCCAMVVASQFADAYSAAGGWPLCDFVDFY